MPTLFDNTNPMRIEKFGYELEGGFDYDLEDNCDYLKHDGSVSVDNGYEGEIASPIFRTFRDFENWSKNVMAETVNETCGLHIHTSFNNHLAYSKCMDKEFFLSWLRDVEKFFRNNPVLNSDDDLMSRFESRLIGDNEYCQRVHSPMSQSQIGWYDFDGDGADRYTMLNFPYRSHGTMECRFYPAVESHEQLCTIVKWHLMYVNNYLASLSTRERGTYEHEIIQEEIVEREVIELCV